MSDPKREQDILVQALNKRVQGILEEFDEETTNILSHTPEKAHPKILKQRRSRRTVLDFHLQSASERAASAIYALYRLNISSK